MELTSEAFPQERRDSVLAFLVAAEKTRLSREAAEDDEQTCPEWASKPWPEVLANLMTGVALGWVWHFTVGGPEDPPVEIVKPDLHYCLTRRGARAVNVVLRREGYAVDKED